MDPTRGFFYRRTVTPSRDVTSNRTVTIRRTLTTVLAAGLLLAAACTPMASRGQFAVPDGPCADATMLWARGSSMAVRSGEARAAQRRFRDGMAAVAPGLTAATLELGDLDADGTVDQGGYPAVPGGLMAGLDTRADLAKDLPVIGGFNESVRLGADELVSVLGTLSARCPEQAFVVAGISQGAEAVMRGLDLLPEELMAKVAAVHVFGDPGFVVGPWMVKAFKPEWSYGRRLAASFAFSTVVGALVRIARAASGTEKTEEAPKAAPTTFTPSSASAAPR